MIKYKITKTDLESFAKDVYEQGCNGFLDLKNSVAKRMVSEFLIAQEVEEILPELVENRDNGYKAVKYDKLVSLLIEGIKDLSKQVDDLKKQINK